jgi:arylsulfatase A-like enzyme
MFAMYRISKTRALLFVCQLLLANLVAGAGDRPNILVVLTDDLGFSDLGSYGAEIDTPHLDKLAHDGIRFSQFYNTAKCHSSRISLLTGRWALQAGNRGMARSVTVAEVLQQAGYFTMMTGKWHLDKEPTDFGFDRFFGHLSGACNYFTGDDTFRLNGKPWTVPATGFYTTIAKVDFALEFLAEARAAEKPWFLYIAFNAPHAPLQPLEVDYRKYLGRYDVGWDAIHAARIAKQQQLGLFADTMPVPERPAHIPAWDALDPDMRAFEARRMAAYAGMIDRVDQEMGRLLANLEASGELDNTLIVFLSDNGACPYDRRRTNIDREPFHPDVNWSDSTGWAWARNAPFRFYKQNQYEGGVTTPAIFYWPRGLAGRSGQWVHEPAHLVDLLPTIADVTGSKIPQTWPNRTLTQLAGVSLAGSLRGTPLINRPPIHFLYHTDRGLRDGDWKLVSFQSQPWELYNIARDRTEMHNVIDQEPAIAKRMIAQWHEMMVRDLRAPGRSNDPVAESATGHHNPNWTDYSVPLPGARERPAARR